MTSPYDDPDAAIAKVQSDIAEAQARAAAAVDVRAAIDRVRGRARSPRGEVDVEADATGQITDLQLADAALLLRPQLLATLIRETTRAATAAAGRLAVTLTDDAYGEDSAYSAHLRAELDARATAR